MNVFLWIVQGFLAAMFALSGLSKLTQPKEKLGEKYHWMKDASTSLVLTAGLLETLGAVGVILPAATGIATVLTPVAATGLAAMTCMAVAMHIGRKEYSTTAVPGVLLALSVLVAWGRYGPHGW